MAQAAFGLGPALAIVLPLLVCGLVISPGLTAVACVVVPVLVLVNHFGARAVRKSTRAWQDAWMAVSRHLHTTLRTINLIRVRSADAAETTRAAVLAAAW